MVKKNFLALGTVALFVLIGGGCKSEANVEISPPPAAASVDASENTNTGVNHETEIVTPSSTSGKNDSQEKVIVDTKLNTKIAPTIQVKPEIKVVTPPAPSLEVKPEIKPEVKVEIKEELKSQPEVVVAVKELTVVASNFSFSPSTLTVKKGDKVRLTLKNSGGFHDWRIDEFNIGTRQIGDATQDVIEFTADKVGSFEYYCSVGSHRAMGMKGTLTVTP